MEGPVLTQSEVWKVGSGICTDLNENLRSNACVTPANSIMVDNKPTEASKHAEAGTQDDIPTISQTAVTKVDQLHSAVPQDTVRVGDLSTGPGLLQGSAHQHEPMSGDGPTRRERFTSDRQQASQEITILVTNHETSEMRTEESEKIEIPTFLEPVTSAARATPVEDESLDGSKVVADLIELSQLQEISMISNSSAGQSASLVQHDLAKTDRCREAHTEQTSSAGGSADSATEAGSADQKDPMIKVALQQTISLEHRDTEDVLQGKLGDSSGPQHHVQTQVSLEVMYHSVATSPMTPPQGSTAFSFPYSPSKLDTSGGEPALSVEMKDAELQVGVQVEYRSVATAPMTPVVKNAPEPQVETRSVATAPMTPVVKNAPDFQVETRSVATAPMTPIVTAAPELYVETHSVATAPMTPIVTAAPELHVETRSVATAPMTPIVTAAPELHVDTRSVATAPMTPIVKAAPGLLVETCSVATAPMTPIVKAAPGVLVETCSVATAPMTPIVKAAPGLLVETCSVATAPMTPLATNAPHLLVETRSVATAPMTPIAKTVPELHVEIHSVATCPMTPIATIAPHPHVETHSVATAPMTPFARTAPELEAETRSVATAPMTPIATRAPQLHVETRSVATAPMTPIATRAPQLHVETRSVATAPMTPLLTKAPELQVHSVTTSPMSPVVLSSPELIPVPEPRAEPGPEEPSEPVQEVSWDEKGMTWEVYGAVVEVAVLGTAIQKHLEKQVKKQRRPSTGTPPLAPNTTDTSTALPSSPPAASSSSRCSSATGSRKKEEGRGTRGRRRPNPLRLFARNVRRPSCCSRAHSEERH